ncbi:MAG: hypothetical protein ACT4QG_23225 [Sporichthyaceae bacterium]
MSLPLVLQGGIEQITGAAMPGAQVLLSAWPSNESVIALPIGGEIELTPLARTVASEDGTYTLRASVTDLVRSLAGPDGLDIQLDVFHGDRHYTHLSQVTRTLDGTWVRELTGLVDPLDDVVDAATNLLDLTLDKTKAVVEGGLGVTGTGPVAANVRNPVPPGCTPFQKVGDELAWQTVATSLTRKHVTAIVSFTEEARVESSTGASFRGGLFSAGGSRSRSISSGGTFDDDEVRRRGLINVEYQFQVLHAFMQRSCARDFRGGEEVLLVTTPLEVTQATRIEESKRPAWTCTAKDFRTISSAQKDYVINRERAAVYQRAFSLAPPGGGGFSGASLSGYSSALSITLQFRLPKNSPDRKKYLCGDTRKPDTSGQRIQGFFE